MQPTREQHPAGTMPENAHYVKSAAAFSAGFSDPTGLATENRGNRRVSA